jgi:hypothetical protein
MEIAKQNIIKAEEEPEEIDGKEKVNSLIKVVNEKLDISQTYLLKFCKNEKDIKSLNIAVKYAREARIKSIDALEKAKSIKLCTGLFYVKFNILLMILIFEIYIIYHWYFGILWFHHDYYIEVIYFSLFGVLTNLTYSAAKHVLKQDFDIWHKGWYLSKIVQAPFITLALILFLKSVDIEALGIPINLKNAPNETIVAIAYIIGLSSRRTWEFIERIKEWLLPLSKSKNKK